MKRIRLVPMASVALLFATAASCSEPLPEDSMNAVRTMLRVAQQPMQDALTLDYEIIELDYSQPEVFYGMIRLEGDWPVARRKAAFDAFLATLGDMDFADETNGDRILARKATSQCISMNYTNALPHMWRLVLNPTFAGLPRRREIKKCLSFSPVNDETTDLVETIFTNRVAFTWEDRGKCFETYAPKVVAASHSNLVSQSVCDRAASVFSCNPTEWQLSAEYDYFWENYYSGYALSSNRLQFVNNALLNTNIAHNSNWRFLKEGLIAVTNDLLSSGQPLVQLNIGVGGN